MLESNGKREKLQEEVNTKLGAENQPLSSYQSINQALSANPPAENQNTSSNVLPIPLHTNNANNKINIIPSAPLLENEDAPGEHENYVPTRLGHR